MQKDFEFDFFTHTIPSTMSTGKEIAIFLTAIILATFLIVGYFAFSSNPFTKANKNSYKVATTTLNIKDQKPTVSEQLNHINLYVTIIEIPKKELTLYHNALEQVQKKYDSQLKTIEKSNPQIIESELQTIYAMKMIEGLNKSTNNMIPMDFSKMDLADIAPLKGHTQNYNKKLDTFNNIYKANQNDTGLKDFSSNELKEYLHYYDEFKATGKITLDRPTEKYIKKMIK